MMIRGINNTSYGSVRYLKVVWMYGDYCNEGKYRTGRNRYWVALHYNESMYNTSTRLYAVSALLTFDDARMEDLNITAGTVIHNT